MLMLLEGGVRLAYPYIANYNLEMWRYFAEIKRPLSQEKLPFFHYPNRQGNYYGIQVKTNSHGYREREFSLQKPVGTKRVVLLGDSITLGWGVSAEETMAKVLETQLRKDDSNWEVLNMGVGNYNSMMEVALFKKIGIQAQPDIAILIHFVNDAEPVPHLAPWLYPLRRASYLMALCFDTYTKLRPCIDPDFRWKDYYQNLYTSHNPALSGNRAALQELAALCKAQDIELLFVNFPELHQLAPYPFPETTAYVAQLAQENALPFVDLLSCFEKEPPESLWVSGEDTHGNGKANRIAAHALYQALRTHAADYFTEGVSRPKKNPGSASLPEVSDK